MTKKRELSTKDQAILAGVVVTVLALALGVSATMASRQEREIREQPLAHQRAKHPTHLRVAGKAPQDGEPLDKIKGAAYVQYNSAVGPLGAWIVDPQNGVAKHPTVLWAHGGFALGKSDLADIYPFIQAGFLVMLPAWRGENGNPGNFEMCFGEVDDAVAALKYLQSRDDVDPERIFAAGHSVGATTVLLMAEMAPGLRRVAACGAYPDMREGGAYEQAPFNKSDIYETELRSPAEHTKYLTCPVSMYFGADEPVLQQAEKMKQEATKLGKQVTVEVIPGTDHFTALKPAVNKMVAEFSAE